MPSGAVGVLLMMLLILNPLLRFLSRAPSSRCFAFSRNEILTVYISCLFSTLVPGHGGETFGINRLDALKMNHQDTTARKTAEFRLHKLLSSIPAAGQSHENLLSAWLECGLAKRVEKMVSKLFSQVAFWFFDRHTPLLLLHD